MTELEARSSFSLKMHQVLTMASTFAAPTDAIETHHLLRALFTVLCEGGEFAYENAKNIFERFTPDSPLPDNENLWRAGAYILSDKTYTLLENAFTALEADSPTMSDGYVGYIHILKACVWSRDVTILSLLSDAGLAEEYINRVFRTRFKPHEKTTTLDSKDILFGINRTVLRMIRREDWFGLQAYLALLEINPYDFQTFLLEDGCLEKHTEKLANEQNWVQLYALRQLSDSRQDPPVFSKLPLEILRAMPR